MSTQLSKMHVRFIQTQKSFYLLSNADSKPQNLPLSHLYVKDNASFYLINQNTPMTEDQTLTITFKEPTPALDRLDCDLKVHEIHKESEDYEDAVLFFHVDPESITQVLLLTIRDIR